MIIEHLRAKGLCHLEVVPWVRDFAAHLEKCEKYPGHVKARPREGIWCHSMADVMRAPAFLEYAKSLTPIATEYFGEQATMWSLNAFYTDENTPHIPGINGEHCDREAEKILCLFMFGTDTTAESAQVLNGHEIFGPAGTAWLADTRHLHYGKRSSASRMLAWARWAAPGLPQAFYDEQLPVIP